MTKSASPELSYKLFANLKSIISEQTGLNIREQDSEKLSEAASLRIKYLRLSSPEEYYQFLKTDNEKSKAEFRGLTICLTTGETYFFRDRGQFSLLRYSILPELIELRRSKRTLKIWSAGCSTGEEAYSVAILVNELIKNPPVSPFFKGGTQENYLSVKGGTQEIPPLIKGGEGGLEGWNIQIIGTDINEDALIKARRGYYRDWSFRMVSEDIKKKWFRKVKEGWRLNRDIIEMVKFETVDLINDAYPDYTSAIHDIDLILCRNVFIYFIPDVVLKVISKLSKTLNDDGYLMTGHAELSRQAFGSMRLKVFPESVVYQKSSGYKVRELETSIKLKAESSKLKEKPFSFQPLTLSYESQPEIRTPQSIISEARELFKKGNYLLTIERLRHILQANPEYFDAHCLIGQTYANIGDYGKAESHLKRAIEIDKFKAEPYYLLGQIAREKGRLEDEEEFLKKVIYLEPSHIPAYLEMGIIYEGKGDRGRAFKMRNSALNLLKVLPSDGYIEPYTELTVGELIRHVQEMLK